MFVVAFAVVFVILLILDYLLKKSRFDNTVNIPGPRVYPFIGNLLFLSQKNINDVLRNIIDYTKVFGLTVRAWGADKMFIITLDPKDIESIQSNPKFITKSNVYRFIVPWLQDGLLVSSGKKWHQRRKILTPTYHFTVLEQFVDVFSQQSDILVEKLKPVANGEAFDIHPYIAYAALDVIAETAMSTKLNAQFNPNSEYVNAITEMGKVMMSRVSNIFYQYDILFRILAPDLVRRQKKAVEILHGFSKKIIQQRRKALLEENGNILPDKIEDDVGRKKRITFLDLLLQSNIDGHPLSDKDIQEEVDTFVFEGHDTTSSGVSFCLYCISRHKDIQDKLFEEITRVSDNYKGQPMSLPQLNDLKYMDLVIKESMRLYPPVPLIARLATEHTIVNDRKIPKGAEVVIPILILHQNPEIFPEPEKFIPERHLPENKDSTRKTPFAYIPFSAGSRNCIGQKFAMFEMKCVISKILNNFELLSRGDAPQTDCNLILRSMNGVNLAMKPRMS